MLTTKIAREIVRETSNRLQRNINIMDIDGVIIASKDASRIGLTHEGALEVLRSGNTLIIDAKQDNEWEVAQPGVNLPIVFQAETIGVIGITGDPDEMKDVGELVKMTTELMIKQEFIASQLEWRQHTKDMIVGELLKTNPSHGEIQRALSLLKLDLNPPFLMIMIEITERAISNQALIQKLEDSIGSHNNIVSFINVHRILITLSGLDEDEAFHSVHRVFNTMKKTDIVFKMAYSLPFSELDRFNQSYLDCDLTLQISEDSQELVSFTNIEVKSLIYQLDETLSNRFFRRIFKDGSNSMRSKTLKAFFANGLNIQKTADALYVHRNTLIYRLNKFTRDTGYDPRKFEDALNLQVALWIAEKMEGKL
ncbi:CdaR family transcriptional regulator [Sporosarcina jiandibaonis]|uniref:CdaR family transcriptional regulator n=1 Tax=Sporosarcina jiandibaonis TaxID=2715535 RepID=UPI0015547A35|nr:sugar diacid recognition domain-containing protein [Sporosarcina jiandibaonis]